MKVNINYINSNENLQRYGNRFFTSEQLKEARDV